MPPRTFYGLPPSWNPGYEIPDYVMAEPPGRGTFTTAWLPRGTISQMIPDFSAVDVGHEILGRNDAGLGSLGDDTLGVGASARRPRDPIANYGTKAASWLMHSIKSVPADKRSSALRAIFDAVDSSLWGKVEQQAKTLRAAGGTPQQALQDAIAISLSAGLLAELVEAGKRARRGQKPAISGQLALGTDAGAVPRAQVYALEALGWNPISAIKDAAQATGSAIKGAAVKTGGAIKGAAQATAGFVVNGIKTLGSLACGVVGSSAGAAAAGSNPYAAAGSVVAGAVCGSKSATAAAPTYIPPPPPKRSWVMPAILVASAVGVGAIIVTRKR